VIPRLESWMEVAIAAHRFEHPVAPISGPPDAAPVETLPAGTANGPAWPAFRAIARPRHARYLSFADREHLLRYARARADIPT
jgi:hypothetical protein